MSVRSSGYDSEALDRVFRYFMRTILRLQRSGVEELPVKNDLPGPYGEFLDTAMEIFLACEPPELARLLLEAEYGFALKREGLTREEILGLRTIVELTWHIRYDGDCCQYLLETQNIWGNTALEYVALTFYPNLPEEARAQYFPEKELYERIPPQALRLDDY